MSNSIKGKKIDYPYWPVLVVNEETAKIIKKAKLKISFVVSHNLKAYVPKTNK
jgi:hypothetical protein